MSGGEKPLRAQVGRGVVTGAPQVAGPLAATGPGDRVTAHQMTTAATMASMHQVMNALIHALAWQREAMYQKLSRDCPRRT